MTNATNMTPTPDLTPAVLTAEQVAIVLAVTGSTIENLHRTGQLQGIKIGRHLRWRRADVDAFLEKLGPE